MNNYPDLNGKLDVDCARPVQRRLGAFPAFRLAEPFEEIRERTERHAHLDRPCSQGSLLKRGDVKMRTARAQFALNFFGCAGFEITESEDDAGTKADLIVLCSSDPEYLAFAQEVCRRADSAGDRSRKSQGSN